MHLGMTVHASLRVRQVRMRRDFDEAVAITAIHSELGNVNVVGKRHRLNRLITDARIFWRDIIPGGSGQSTDSDDGADGDLERQPIRPFWKKIRHNESRGVSRSEPRIKKMSDAIK